MDDLAAVMRGAPDIVALPKVAEPHHVARLDRSGDALRTRLWHSRRDRRRCCRTSNLPAAWFRPMRSRKPADERGLPLGLRRLAADLGAERGQDGIELAYCRQRFLVECVAAGVVAVDCPYTWSDLEGVDARCALGAAIGLCREKPGRSGACRPSSTALCHPLTTNFAAPVEIVTAFETARAAGQARVEVDGSLVEVPTYFTAKRLLARGRGDAAIRTRQVADVKRTNNQGNAGRRSCCRPAFVDFSAPSVPRPDGPAP